MISFTNVTTRLEGPLCCFVKKVETAVEACPGFTPAPPVVCMGWESSYPREKSTAGLVCGSSRPWLRVPFHRYRQQALKFRFPARSIFAAIGFLAEGRACLPQTVRRLECSRRDRSTAPPCLALALSPLSRNRACTNRRVEGASFRNTWVKPLAVG